jgi:hypothetical protein
MAFAIHSIHTLVSVSPSRLPLHYLAAFLQLHQFSLLPFTLCLFFI